MTQKKKKKNHTKCGGFSRFNVFVFFLIFAFSCLIFSAFPPLLDFLKPKSGPSNEVIGIYIYIFVFSFTTNFLYHDTARHLLRDTFTEVLGSGVVGTLPRLCRPGSVCVGWSLCMEQFERFLFPVRTIPSGQGGVSLYIFQYSLERIGKTELLYFFTTTGAPRFSPILWRLY